MLRSNRLYKWIRIILMLLSILAMLGFNNKIFAESEIEINVYSSDNYKGVVEGGGVYNINDSVTINANALNGCVFRGWFLDPEYKNLYSLESTVQFTVLESGNYYALFDLESNTIVNENQIDINVQYSILVLLAMIYLDRVIGGLYD